MLPESNPKKSCRGSHHALRLHRNLLQSQAPPLSARLSLPTRVRKPLEQSNKPTKLNNCLSAFSKTDQCPVALKVVSARLIGDESARRRFVREARAAASVRHPNVASVFHLGKSGDSYFYAMEFVDGESLDKVIRRSGRLEPSIALKVTALVAGGLEAIDKQNLVHRDIKPSNVMVR